MKTPKKTSNHGKSDGEGAVSTSEELKIRARFYSLCVALKLPSKGQALADFVADEVKWRKVKTLIRDEFWLLENGSLKLKKKNGSGYLRVLQNEPRGKTGKRSLFVKNEPATECVRRLLGFVRCKDGWTLLPRNSKGEADDERVANQRRKESLWQTHADAYSVLPKRVRERIFQLSSSRPTDLEAYVIKAIAHIRNAEGDPLPALPWIEPADFKNGRDFILEFLGLVGAATSGTVITVASINSYITASVGRKLFLEALQRGVRVRFLIFDFLNGDAKGVAKMIHRSPEAFYSSAWDTVEALRRLQRSARRLGCDKYLEVCLLDDDPVGRWYILDDLSEPIAFFALRKAKKPSKSADAAGGRRTGDEARVQAEVVEKLWAKAGDPGHQFAHWLKAYEVWKAKPETRRMLGLE